jgi:hypothetical protein
VCQPFSMHDTPPQLFAPPDDDSDRSLPTCGDRRRQRTRSDASCSGIPGQTSLASSIEYETATIAMGYAEA